MNRTALSCLVLAVALSGTAATVTAATDEVSATMVASEVLVQDGIADATFTIEVTNGEYAPASNVRVVFDDGREVVVGDVDARTSRSSTDQRRVIDISATPTHNVPVHATLMYSLDGADVEAAITLILRIS